MEVSGRGGCGGEGEEKFGEFEGERDVDEDEWSGIRWI